MRLTETLNSLEFNGKMNSLENLFSKIEDLIFYLEAQGQVKTAEQLLACNWELKTRMQCDREEQWLWTFVWMKDKVLRKLGVETDPSTSLRAWVEVHTSALTPYSKTLAEDLESPLYTLEMPAVLNLVRL